MARVRTAVSDLVDRFSASDPGLIRLSSALTTVGSILLVLLVLDLMHTAVTLLVAGALGAMVASFAISDPRPRDQAITLALGLPVALAVVTVGAELSSVRAAADAAFVVVIFTAVYIRRFGPRGTGLGMIGFQLYFVAQFTHAVPAQLGKLYLILAVAFGSAAVVRFGLVRATPQRVLDRLGHAFRARLAATVEAIGELAVELPGSDPAEAAAEALRRRTVRLHECALMIQAKLEVSVPDPRTASLIEHRVAQAEIAAERVGRLVLRVHRQTSPGGADLDPAMRVMARQLRQMHSLMLRNLSGPRLAGFDAARDELLGYRDGSGIPAGAAAPVQDAFRALGELARAILGLRLAFGYETEPETETETETETEYSAETENRAELKASRLQDGANTVLSREELDTEALCLEAQDDDQDRGAGPTGLHRLTTRLAFQVSVGSALAVLGGELLSPQRWYWAVLTCWVVFVNASSTGDILVKGYRRLAGTIVGVLAGAALAGVVGGDQTVAFALVIVCVFGMFYTAPLSYSLMSFFVTTMIGVLYTLLGIFSDGLLVLRIEETALGAACGFIAATFVLPVQISRRTDKQLADVLDQLRATLSLAVAQLAGGPVVDVFHSTRGLDAALDTLRSSVEPITHPASPLRARRRRARYVLGVLEGSAYHVRSLSAAAELSFGDPRFGPAPGLAAIGRRLDQNAHVLADFVRSEGHRTGRLDSEPDLTTLLRQSVAGSPAGTDGDAPARVLPEGMVAWHVLPHLQRLDEALLALARPLGFPSADDDADDATAARATATPDATAATTV